MSQAAVKNAFEARPNKRERAAELSVPRIYPVPTWPRVTEDSLAVTNVYGIVMPLVLAPLWRSDLASPPTDLFRISGA